MKQISDSKKRNNTIRIIQQNHQTQQQTSKHHKTKILTETAQNIHSNTIESYAPDNRKQTQRNSAQIQDSNRQQQIASCFLIWHTGRESYRHLLKVLSLLCYPVNVSNVPCFIQSHIIT